MNEITRIAPDGTKVALSTTWLRVTQNPVCPDRYPKTGQTVILKGHKLLPDDQYLILMVEEFEPAYFRDRDGRDIRISVYPRSNGIGYGLNGENFVTAMIEGELVDFMVGLDSG